MTAEFSKSEPCNILPAVDALWLRPGYATPVRLRAVNPACLFLPSKNFPRLLI
jgi:hypothetical protein